MSASDLLARFENATLSGGDFDHAAHVEVAWRLLQQDSALRAADRFCRGLRRLATALGAPGNYHETISCALVFLIAERVAGAPQTSWASFRRDNPDLFEWPSPLLAARYPADVLDSALARRVFVLPPGAGRDAERKT